MLFCMSVITGIGLLIKYTLIPGQERWVIYGENNNLYLLGMNRHEWGYMHLIIGYILLGLLALHIILHWNTITCIYNRIFGKKLFNKLLAITFITFCALFIIVPFLIHPDVNKIKQGTGTHAINNTISTNRKQNTTHKKDKFYNAETSEIKSHKNHVIDVRGYMTLNEIAVKYKVTTDYIKASLNIPKSISDRQKLGWIRKKYNIEITDVAEIIKEYEQKDE